MGKSIERYFSKTIFDSAQKELSFLAKVVADSNGELDFQIRPNNSLNIYYKGNSLAEVKAQNGSYRIKIHRKFEAPTAVKKDKLGRFKSEEFSRSGEYDSITVKPDLMPKFFQKKIMQALQSKIKEVNNGEEIAFEQSLMTDNLGREDFIIIDRQVGGGGLPGILDLLALKKMTSGKYRFVVLEVKLGNNKELSSEVAGQLQRYEDAIRNNIESFRECYELNYQQKKALGLFLDDGSARFPNKISIDVKVEGKIVVGFYSKTGERQIKELLKKHPDLRGKIKTCWHMLEA